MNIKKILIAEDSEFNQMIIEEILNNSEFEYKMVVNGKKVIEELSVNDYDAILLDIEMPVMDGRVAARTIRLDFENDKKNILIIGLTAHKDKKIINELKQYGINTFLEKPFTLEQLNLVLKDSTINTNSGSSSSLTEEETVYDLTYLKELAAGDETFIKEMLKIFLSEAPKAIENMENHYKNGNWIDLRITAHKYGPQANFAGLSNIIKDIENIETSANEKKNIDSIPRIIERIKHHTTIAINKIKIDYNL